MLSMAKELENLLAGLERSSWRAGERAIGEERAAGAGCGVPAGPGGASSGRSPDAEAVVAGAETLLRRTGDDRFERIQAEPATRGWHLLG